MNSAFQDKTLFYFTNSYPFGNSPLWKVHELTVLKRHFGRIVVVPLSNGGDNEPRDLIEGVEYFDPIIDAEFSRRGRSLLEKLRITASLLGTPVPCYFLRELLSRQVLFSSGRLRALLKATYELALYKKSAAICDVFDSAARGQAILYFYWGIGAVNAVLLRDTHEIASSACRFHGWDLYEDRHETKYIPFRKQLLRRLDLLLPCSADGAEHLKSKTSSITDKIFIARLGTISEGRSKMQSDNVLKLVSCSRMVAVKRLDLLCEALTRIPFPVRWTHIGDGDLMPIVRSYAERFPPYVQTDFRGSIPSDQVPKILSQEAFDLFLNTSSSEGVPVSIMEAFAAGIPVLATDVGGTSELVDETVGRLVPASISASELARSIADFSGLDPAAMLNIRENAFQRYKDRCDALITAEALAQVLLALE